MAAPSYQVLIATEHSAVDLAANILALVRLLYLKGQGSLPQSHPTTQLLNEALRDAIQCVRRDPKYDSLGDQAFKNTFEELTEMVWSWGDDRGCDVENLEKIQEVLGEFKQKGRCWEIYLAAEVIVRG